MEVRLARTCHVSLGIALLPSMSPGACGIKAVVNLLDVPRDRPRASSEERAQEDEEKLEAANVLGDADSTACIAGQLAGSFYGDASIDRRLLDMLRVWDPDREIEMRAALLFCAGQA